MNKLKSGMWISVLLMSMVLLSGCLNSETPAEKMHTVLEDAVAAEKGFEEQQTPLVELEKQEKELYDQIIALSMKEFEEIQKLSDEALASADQREEHMNEEKQSIDASKEEFQKIPDLIEEMEEEELKSEAQQLYDTMMDRYELHDTLYNQYSEALNNDKQLYELFKTKDLQLEQLEEQITLINDSYEQVLETNKKFNEKTADYNEIKLSFYQAAGLNVNTEDE
ncbi:YkyA family protein [Cytobacillus gottheilii]|uniref:YkyA family protein n=1 Tax=Cytobacillus gottheilii TaxID=859144 RepID=A0ABX8FGG9_9BACI|nr:YkyA family protein [Cytobacillus gottheilii]QVY63123.1 YkyA family protein [Cytobacillus gottheilii]